MDVGFAQDTWPRIAWRGEGASVVAGDAPIRAPLPWGGLEAVDEVGPDVRMPPDVAAPTQSELAAIRIGANWPSEAEIDGTVTRDDWHRWVYTVNFEKGCYTGQEFVAQVHYRDAAPPRRLVQIVFAPG
jgi:folate-binding protein YgfZ